MKNNSRLKKGSYFLTLSAIVIMTVIVLNIAVSLIPSRYRMLETDGYDIYEISDTTRKLTGKLTESISIVLVAQESGVDTQLDEFLGRYAQYSDKISYGVVDPIVYPTIETISGSDIEISSLEENSVIVSSSVRDKVIGSSELYKREYSEQDMTYYSMGYTPDGTLYFYGEDKISGAIDYVLADSLPILYVTSGHGEAELGNDILYYIESNNYSVSSLNMQGISDIPKDASCILMNAPALDISKKELDMLSKYINGGGRVILITDYLSRDGDFTNLKAFTLAYGMEAKEGRAIEEDTEHYNEGDGTLIPKLSETDTITMNYTEYGAVLKDATAFTLTDRSDEGINTSKLIYTTTEAYTEGAYDTESGETERLYEGECVLGAIATTKDKGGALVWYTSTSMTNDDVISYGGASVEITKATLQSLCDKHTDLSIAGKAVSSPRLVFNESDINFWTTLLTLLIPLGVILVGVAISYTRRVR